MALEAPAAIVEGLVRRAEELGVPALDLTTIEIDRQTARLIPASTAEKIRGVVVGWKARNVLALVSTDPTNVYIHDHVEFVTRGKYRAVLLLGDADQINLARKYIYSDDADATALVWSKWLRKHYLATPAVEVRGAGEVSSDADLEAARSAHLVEAVNDVLRQAVAMNASDIHLENLEDAMVVRFRIDGVLERVAGIPRNQARAHVQRIKIMSEMDIANDRLPQGGRISLAIGDQTLDLRVSTVPSKFGENVVLRLLNRQSSQLTLPQLGMSPHGMRRFSDVVSRPHGLFLVSGPTGSGKSTTLYAALGILNTEDRKILTVEDPVESVMAGITQVQVNIQPREEERRLTFARALREFLRQDPDVVMIGEIRDEESATIACEAAMTGHLVFSTVHTNDAIGVMSRLKEMRVPPYVISNTLLGVLAQRLVRRICDHCRVAAVPSDEESAVLREHGIEEPWAMARGTGCDACRRTGYRGRVGVYELIVVNKSMRLLIEQDTPAVQLEKEAMQNGLVPLYVDALRKMAQGITTFSELKRVVSPG